MPDPLSGPYNNASTATSSNAPDKGTEAPPITPSTQVASHQNGLDKGPPPPVSVGPVVDQWAHLRGMNVDQKQSDKNNNYVRPTQSPSSEAALQKLAQKFTAAKQHSAAEKAREFQKSRNQDRERGDD